MHGAQFNKGQTRGLPEQKIAGHATVVIEELRCTGGASETTTPSQKTTGGSGCSWPDGLTLPTAQSPEKTPHGCAAGRDVVRVVASRAVQSTGGNPPNPPCKPFVEPRVDGVCASGEGTRLRH